MKNLTEEYVEIDWAGICSDFDLDHGDITPEQSFELDRALGNINEILHNFINQNKSKVHLGEATLTNTEYNVLLVALDHMYEHLDDMRGDFDGDEDNEIDNLKRIADVRSLQKLFKI